MLTIGTLDQRVIIETPTEVRDAYGALALTWATLATVWADARALSGREMLERGAATSATTWRVWLRYRSDVTPSLRLRLADGTLLNILAVMVRGRKESLELIAEVAQ